MLDEVFRYARVRQRIRANPCSAILEQFTAYLVARGYSPSTTRQYVYVAAHFGQWLRRRPVTPGTVQTFIARHLPACRCRVPGRQPKRRVRMALNRLLEMLGLPARAPEPASEIGILMKRYADHMSQVQGLASSTIACRTRYAHDMMAGLGICDVRQLAGLTAEQVATYVAREGGRYAPGSGQLIASSIRAFLRYLLLHKLIERDLSGAVPVFANWRLASLPATLSESELERLVDTVDTGSAIGLRDRAILLCLIDLGMRASDVTGLELGGVDLTGSVLRLRCRKQRRPVSIPMTARLASAIRQYVRRGRPRGDTSTALFVRHRAPGGGFVTSSGVQFVVRRRAAQAGLTRCGTHVIRHSVASRMINAGATLKQIADLLGHRSLTTTAIYTKVDMTSLRQVALPWPMREVLS